MQIVCGGCKSRLKVPDSLAGKVIKCPKCARKMKAAARAVEGESPRASAKEPARTGLKAGAPAKAPAKAPAAPKTKTSVMGNGKAAPAPTKPAAKQSTRLKPSAVQSSPPTEEPGPSTVTRTPPKKPEAAPARPPFKPRPAAEDGEGRNKLVWIGGGAGAVALIAILWFFVFGSSQAVVTGTVTMNGAPLVNAEVKYVAEDTTKGGTFPAQTNEEGVYQVVGPTSSGSIPAGKYKIVIAKQVAKDGSAAKEDGPTKSVVPAAYTSVQTTPLSREVQAGKNVFDFDIPPP